MKVELLTYSGNDLLVVNAARASFGKESKELNEKDKKLIKYLAEHKHWLPFRHPQITLRCKAPMFVARQVQKHQVGFSWSEESRRYIDTPPEFYWPDKWRKRAENVKQGSSDEQFNVTSCSIISDAGEVFGVYSVCDIAISMYEKLLEDGCAPEQARMILPQNMYVTWVWTGSLLGYATMVKQRTAGDAQRETQEFAKLIEAVVAPLYPVSWEHLQENLG